MPFQPGQSGNPGGRVKGPVNLLRERYGQNGEKLWDALEALAFGAVEESTRLLALKYLADQMFGKAKERIEHSGELALPAVHYHGPTPDEIDLRAILTPPATSRTVQ